MATYKLIQDIEAEDHILGPLTLRQFIFALVAAFCWYLSFILFVKHIYFMLIVTVPPGLFCTFFAIPFGRDQPTEIWALAKLRFLFKPRRRIWDQSGVKELVTITVPKKVERVLTKGFSQTEVQSRLKALANTLDTRGWAIKNIDAGNYSAAGRYGQQADSDRLIDIGAAPQEVPSYDVQASDDILDVSSNPVAQQFQSMINQSSAQHRQHIMAELGGAGADVGANPASPVVATSPQPAPAINPAAQPGQADDWFLTPPASNPMATAAATTAAPQLLSQQPLAYSHMRTLRPIGQQGTGAQSAAPAASAQPQANNGVPSGAAAPDPAILSLANNNDLNVSTIARQAYKATHDDEPPQDEVVISLH
ncbi:MAG TPA: PrgI family protein [Candidatus Saccharimonadales bacterium]|nr:PrgI family protein [Candidatus Saccharimonadales bacterium]